MPVCWRRPVAHLDEILPVLAWGISCVNGGTDAVARVVVAVEAPAAGVLALMMGAGFALSLCSSSDAVIARSLRLVPARYSP